MRLKRILSACFCLAVSFNNKRKETQRTPFNTPLILMFDLRFSEELLWFGKTKQNKCHI